MKHLRQAAAVLLFALSLSGPADALVLNSGTGGQASLALVVYDPNSIATNPAAYIRDLGVSFSEWNASPALGSLADLSGDANWQTFLGQVDPASVVVQIVSYSQGAVGGFSLLASGDGTSSIFSTSYSQAWNTVRNFYTKLNLLGIPTGGSLITHQTPLGTMGVGYPGNPGSIGVQFGTSFDVSLGGALNSKIGLYRYDLGSTSDDPFALQYGTFTLTDAGKLTVYAVPEPGTWALLLAGLAAVGWLGRRRIAS